jgi:hypothetical protein
MAGLETDLLADVIHRKRRCLEQLRDLGRKQLELIHLGNITSLLDVLAVKQQMLLQLDRLERQLDPFRSQDPERRPWRTPDDRRACADDLAQCESLLVEIMRQEKQGERELVQRRDEVAEQLQGTHTAQQARDAYLARSPVAPIPRGLDLSTDGY